MHPAMKVLTRMRQERSLTPDAIRQVRIRTNSKIANILLHNQARDWLEAKFSMPFCCAAVLLRGRAGLNEFNDDFVRSPEVREMMQKIDYRAYDKIEPGYTNTTTLIELELTDGSVLKERVDFPKGSPQDPMSFEEVADKFRECAEYAAWPSAAAEEAIGLVRNLEKLDDASKLARLFGSNSN